MGSIRSRRRLHFKRQLLRQVQLLQQLGSVERDYAESAGLINTYYGKAYMGVDHKNVASKAGRPAVRLESTKTYDSGLVIIDVEHMPGGICGTWPAFWMVGPNWPHGGEIGKLLETQLSTAC